MSDEKTCYACGCALPWFLTEREMAERRKAECMACTTARIRGAYLSNPIDITPDCSAEMPKKKWSASAEFEKLSYKCSKCGNELHWVQPRRPKDNVCLNCEDGNEVEWEPNPDDPFTQVAKAFHETVLPLRNAGSSCTVRKIDGASYSIEVTESDKCRSRMLGRIEQRLRHRGFSEDEIEEIVDDD